MAFPVAAVTSPPAQRHLTVVPELDQGDWTDEWLRGYQDTSLDSYRRVRNRLREYLDGRGLTWADVNFRISRDFLDHCIETYGITDPGVIWTRRVAKSLFAFGLRHEDLPQRTNPFEHERTPEKTTQDYTRRLGLNVAAATALVDAADQGWLRTTLIVRLLLATGLRASSLAAVDLSDLDRDRKGFYGRHKRSGAKAKRQFFTLPPATWALLERYVGERTDGALIVTRTGSRISRQEIWRQVTRTADQAGITHTYPHLLRHTVGTLELKDGKTAEQVMVLLGHDSRSSTDHYLAAIREEEVTLSTTLTYVTGSQRIR